MDAVFTCRALAYCYRSSRRIEMRARSRVRLCRMHDALCGRRNSGDNRIADTRSNRVDDRPFKALLSVITRARRRDKSVRQWKRDPSISSRPRQLWPTRSPSWFDPPYLPTARSFSRRSFVTLHASQSYYFVRDEIERERERTGLHRVPVLGLSSNVKEQQSFSSRSRVIRRRCGA